PSLFARVHDAHQRASHIIDEKVIAYLTTVSTQDEPIRRRLESSIEIEDSEPRHPGAIYTEDPGNPGVDAIAAVVGTTVRLYRHLRGAIRRRWSQSCLLGKRRAGRRVIHGATRGKDDTTPALPHRFEYAESQREVCDVVLRWTSDGASDIRGSRKVKHDGILAQPGIQNPGPLQVDHVVDLGARVNPRDMPHPDHRHIDRAQVGNQTLSDKPSCAGHQGGRSRQYICVPVAHSVILSLRKIESCTLRARGGTPR